MLVLVTFTCLSNVPPPHVDKRRGCAPLQQESHHGERVLLGRTVGRIKQCHDTHVIGCIDVGAMVQQVFDELYLSVFACAHERRSLVICPTVDTDAAKAQAKLDNVLLAMHGRNVNGLPAHGRADSYLGAVVQETLDRLGRASRRAVNRIPARAVALVNQLVFLDPSRRFFIREARLEKRVCPVVQAHCATSKT